MSLKSSLASLVSCFFSLQLISGVSGASSTPTETYHDNNPLCQCYEVNTGGSPIYFHNYRFYDFSHYVVAGNTSTVYSEPPLVTQSGGTENETNSVLTVSPFTDDWRIQSWGAAATSSGLNPRWNSPQNVYLLQSNASDLNTTDATASTFLRIRASKTLAFYSIGEIENSQQNILYGSIRFRARVIGSNGTCAGMFYYASSVHETDIEILTNNAGQIFYTNQPSVKSNGDPIPGATTIVTPDNFSWSDWHEHRIDWTPGVSRWYVDGEYMANNTYEVPKVPMGIIINMWSDGDPEWTGDMPDGGSSFLDLQWVSSTFNTSGPRSGFGDQRYPRPSGKKKRAPLPAAAPASTPSSSGSCSYVCKIDGTSKMGSPEQGSPDYPASDDAPQGHPVQLSSAKRNVDSRFNEVLASGLDAMGTLFGAMSR